MRMGGRGGLVRVGLGGLGLGEWVSGWVGWDWVIVAWVGGGQHLNLLIVFVSILHL